MLLYTDNMLKKFINYFKDFHKDYLRFPLYFLVVLFIGVLIAFNYYFDFEDSYIDSFYGKPLRIALFFACHGLAYYGVLFIIYFFEKKRMAFTWQFWVKSFLGLLILSVDRSVYPWIADFFIDGVPPVSQRFYFKTLYNLYGVLTLILPLFVLWFFFDRRSSDGFFGLRFKQVSIKAYWLMLLIMVPIVFIATYLPGFMEYYPTYKRTGGLAFARHYRIDEWIAKLIYESAYIFDFLNTELFFRGFLVIGLSKLLGKNVVLPMAATYAVLHFGKPMGETISSVFGGYILGVIALYSRNIWGGVFIHGGIAFLMEVFSFLRQ